MDDVTASMLLEQMDRAESDHDLLVALKDSNKAQLKCQSSSGKRVHRIEDRLAEIPESLDRRIDRRFAEMSTHLTGHFDRRINEKLDEKLGENFRQISSLVQECPARKIIADAEKGWKLGPFNNRNVLYVIIAVLLLIIATLTGTDLTAVFNNH